MGKQTMYFIDAMDLQVTPLSSGQQKSFSDSAVRHQPIIVRIAATHSGAVTKNMTRYHADAMARSCHTWLQDYGKPILKHHQTGGSSLFGDKPVCDPIGRVVNAEYIRTNMEATDAIHEPKEPDGYIQLYAQISDQDAIEKILDGRYLTVSIGCATSEVRCSICNHEISTGELCEHQRGKRYGEDQKLCYWNIGDLDYKECSFVNMPADKYAKIVGIEFDSAMNGMSNQTNNQKKTMIQKDAVLDVMWSTANQEGNSMPIMFDDEKNPLEDKKTQVQDKETDVDPNEGITFSDEDDDLIDFINDAFEQDGETLLGDAKLSPEKRKSLPGSSFCGKKDKSFPVNDCAHVTAALRLLPRYKGPSNKDAIRTCVMRKAKSLGCKTGQDWASDEYKELPDKDFCHVKDGVRSYPTNTADNVINSLENLLIDDQLSAEEKKLVHTALVDRAKPFGIEVGDWSPENQADIKYTKLSLGDATIDQITALPIVKEHMASYVKKDDSKDPYENADEALKAGFNAIKKELDDMKKANDDLKEEIEQRKNEAIQSASESAELHRKLHRNLAEKVVMLKVRTGQINDVNTKDEFEAKVDQFAKREKASLEDTLHDLEDLAPLFEVKTPEGEVSEADAGTKTDDSTKGFEGSVKRVHEDEEEPSVSEMLGLNQRDN